MYIPSLSQEENIFVKFLVFYFIYFLFVFFVYLMIFNLHLITLYYIKNFNRKTILFFFLHHIKTF